MNSFQENIENTFFYIFYIQSPPNPRINSFFLKLQPSHFFNFSVLQLHAKFQRKLTRYLKMEGNTDERTTDRGDYQGPRWVNSGSKMRMWNNLSYKNILPCTHLRIQLTNSIHGCSGKLGELWSIHDSGGGVHCWSDRGT